MTIVQIDPQHLLPHERNLRTDLGDVSDLVASMEAVGILQPLVVTPIPEEPGTFRIVIGHRRHHAAGLLGLESVPCVVADGADDAGQIVRMLGENTARSALSQVEIAQAYVQLRLLDWTPERIATVTAQPASRVRGALALAGLPESAQRAADDGTLTLDACAELEEFAADPAVLARILKRGAGAGWTFQHALAEERRRRDRKVAVERLKAELVLAGVRTVPRPKQWGWGATREVPAADLVDADGQPLDPEVMRTRPGFAAIIHPEAAGGPSAEIVCTDPEAWGYARPAGSSFVSDDVRAERARHEAEVQARREALEVAAGVRQAFLVQAYGTARGAKKAFPEALRVAVADPARLRFADAYADLAARLAGVALLPAAATAGVDRLTRMLVARWVCGHEDHLARIANGQTWDVLPEAAATYLAQLVAAGYELSDAEAQLREHLLADTACEDQCPDQAEATGAVCQERADGDRSGAGATGVCAGTGLAATGDDAAVTEVDGRIDVGSDVVAAA